VREEFALGRKMLNTAEKTTGKLSVGVASGFSASVLRSTMGIAAEANKRTAIATEAAAESLKTIERAARGGGLVFI